jgi:hypothetical protein
MEKYLTEYNASEIKEIIFPTISSVVNNPSKLLTYPKFKGEITDTKIEIDTMETSPTFIRGSIRPVYDNPKFKSEIEIKIDSVDYEKGPLMLIYVFSYIFIAIGFIISVIKNPTNIWVYIITLICCLIPIPLVKLYSFFESMPPTPEKVKTEFLSKIKAVKP